MIFEEILRYVERMLGNVYNFCQLNKDDEDALSILQELQIFDFMEFMLNIMMERGHYNKARTYKRARMLREKYMECCKLIAKG